MLTPLGSALKGFSPEGNLTGLINNLNNSKIQYKVKACGKARRKIWKVAHGRLKLG